jgi:glyoxylase-like metal-dependent hydrolase (beta-lactamase superfamily II)
MTVPYTKGLHEVADGVHAYLQPDGGWGWSNAGLIGGDGASVLVDTLFDLRLTGEMLEAMEPVTSTRPIATVVNTHANGDHCYGNELVAGPGVEIVASAAAAAEMDESPPRTLAALVEGIDQMPDPMAGFVRENLGSFEFGNITITPPTRTFSGVDRFEVGGRVVELIEVGPAHTAGDVLAWLPDERVVFTGDILFIEGTPILWTGPVANWIEACDLIIALEAAVIVPGHGPLTDADGVRAVSEYLRTVEEGTRARHGAGMTSTEAVLDLHTELESTPFGSWGDRERLVINVETIWASLEPGYVRPSVMKMFSRMARMAGSLNA